MVEGGKSTLHPFKKILIHEHSEIDFHTLETHLILGLHFLCFNLLDFQVFPPLLIFYSTTWDSCILAFSVGKSLLSSYPPKTTRPSSFTSPIQHPFKCQFFQLSPPFMEDILLCKQAGRASKDQRRHLPTFLTIAGTSGNTEHSKKPSLFVDISYASSISQNLSWMGILKSISRKCIQDYLVFWLWKF